MREEYQLEPLPHHRTRNSVVLLKALGTRQCRAGLPKRMPHLDEACPLLTVTVWKRAPAVAWEEAPQGLTRGTPVRKPQEIAKTERQLKNPRKGTGN